MDENAFLSPFLSDSLTTTVAPVRGFREDRGSLFQDRGTFGNSRVVARSKMLGTEGGGASLLHVDSTINTC